MKTITQYLLSPNAWVAVFSILAFAGLLLCAIGFAVHVRPLVTIGLWLGVPILVGGIVILLVVIPILLVANRKQQKQETEETQYPNDGQHQM